MRKLIAVILAVCCAAGLAEAAGKAARTKSPCVDFPPERRAQRSSRDLHGLFRPDPPDHWRRIGVDRRDTTSDCVGDPVTPACAIDTMMAAFVARDLDLYRSVYPSRAEEPTFVRVIRDLAKEGSDDVVYRFHRVSDPANAGATGRSRPRYGSPLKGDTIEIAVEGMTCTGRDIVTRYGYILQRSETGWKIIHSFGWDRR